MRTPINICHDGEGGFLAVCDDGSLWNYYHLQGSQSIKGGWRWNRLPNIPQDEEHLGRPDPLEPV